MAVRMSGELSEAALPARWMRLCTEVTATPFYDLEELAGGSLLRDERDEDVNLDEHVRHGEDIDEHHQDEQSYDRQVFNHRAYLISRTKIQMSQSPPVMQHMKMSPRKLRHP
jgi:hypothetical protein